jgi:feruloyl esterase
VVLVPTFLSVFCLPAAATAGVPDHCTIAAARASAPPGMVIKNVPNLVVESGRPGSDPITTSGGVAQVPANARGDGAPEYCYVTGSVVTNAEAGKSANFAAALPSPQHWNGKFLFQGCGGNCGVIFPPNPAGLKRGYAVWATDDGHIAQPDPDPRLWWTIADAGWAVRGTGQRDEEALTDFFYRAVHKVTLAGKTFTRNHYQTAQIRYSYLAGCSDGGREGMVALSRYPEEFDGIIAGAPFFDIANQLVTTLVGVQAQLRTPGAAVPMALFAAADRLISSRCDAVDGVADGLIQDPARCDVRVLDDLPQCGSETGTTDGNTCFTSEQIDSLTIMLSAITDESGRVVYPGFSISNLNGRDDPSWMDLLSDWLGFVRPADVPQGPNPWRDRRQLPNGWYWVEPTLRNFVYDGAVDFNALTTPGITFRNGRIGGIRGLHAVIPRRTVQLLQQKVSAGSGVTPADAAAFLRQNRKLLLYHGSSDGDITPYRTIQYYRELARLHGGYRQLQKNAQLYMVPGMAHCGGGPGPNVFGQPLSTSASTGADHDILEALEQWVEQGRQPTRILASKFTGSDPRQSTERSMPLCPYPAMARYDGHGDVNDAASWRCQADDRGHNTRGPAGRRAGVYAPLF